MDRAATADAAHVLRGEATIVLCGAAGQGIQTIEDLLPRLFRRSGLHVCTTKEYMSRVRGGSNSTTVRVSARPVWAHRSSVDVLVPLDHEAITHVAWRISPRTLILGDRERIEPDRDIVDVPLAKIAEEVGGVIYANVVGTGLIAGLFGLERAASEELVGRFFAGRGEKVVADNRAAFGRGYERGAALVSEGLVRIEIERSPDRRGDLLLSGTEAIALGAIAGGCSFISAYPMTPSTGIFAFLARHGGKLGIIAEQAEDEIAAINMALGAWYAGARAMVTTSGGGFALMVEGLSLAGMIESPAVIYLGQRPGPATGLPTRTEQGDLLFALTAGHGEFPRALLAPGTLEEAFDLTRRAFDIADRCQVPVIILGDQHLVDLQHTLAPLDLTAVAVTPQIVETTPGYRRYEITESGLSPRGVPGFGTGLVGVDSDEHDEDGHITEDLELRVRMADKRLRKQRLVEELCVPARLFGAEGFRILVVGWGSTCGAIREALVLLGRDDVAALHIAQLHPLDGEIRRLLQRAERTIVVENNATGQLAALLKMRFGHDFDGTILQYNGLPFAVEDLQERLQREIDR